jgi:hypothetical protein
MSEENFGPGAVLSDDTPTDNSNEADNNAAASNSAEGGEQQEFGLSEDNQRFAASKGWTGPEDFDAALTSYRELESKFSSGNRAPEGDDVSPEEWDKYARSNGRPESADYYEFTQPDLPENVVYNDAMADAFKPAAHEAGLNQKQAAILHDRMSKYFVSEQQAMLQNQATNIQSAQEKIVNEWGDPSGAKYQDGVKQAFRSIKSQPGLLEAYVNAGLLVPQGKGYVLTNPDIAIAHANIGNSMLKESSGFDGIDGSFSGPNPWEKGKENLTLQGQIFKKDPNLAKALMRQAGHDPGAMGI